jgi:hypothetical protein
MARTETRLIPLRLDEPTLRALDTMRLRNGDISRNEQIKRLIIREMENNQFVISFDDEELSIIKSIATSMNLDENDEKCIEFVVKRSLHGFWTIMNTQLKDLLKPLEKIEREKKKEKH